MGEKPLFESAEVDVEAVMEEIHRRVEARDRAEGRDPAERARALRKEVLGSHHQGMTPEDCELLPKNYVIDWEHPILGPPHAVVRRVINAEIRRYLETSLIRQSRMNRWFLQEIQQLRKENRALRREIEALSEGKTQE